MSNYISNIVLLISLIIFSLAITTKVQSYTENFEKLGVNESTDVQASSCYTCRYSNDEELECAIAQYCGMSGCSLSGCTLIGVVCGEC